MRVRVYLCTMFNIRVYGILIENQKILVTDEFRLGILMTKFPGGGLEYGEGTIDGLKREWKEETGLDIEILSHYYTTDFFQPSYRLPESNQVINIYYLIRVKEPYRLVTTEKKFDFPKLEDGVQSFRWLDMPSVSVEEFTLPIDKVVIEKLIRDFKEGIISL